MILDEAIKHAEEVAQAFDRLFKLYDDASRYTRSHNEDIVSANAKKCLECFQYAKENRQLAEWLKDYKRLLEQESKTGRWIDVTNGRGGHKCDNCHEYAPSYQSGDEYLTKYCPNCGAKMQEVEE